MTPAVTTLASDNGGGKLIHSLFECIDSCEWNRLNTYFDEQIVYERPGYPAIIGLSRLVDFYQHERIPVAGKHSIEEIVSSARSMVCIGLFKGVSRTNEALSTRFADYYELHDGRIVFRRTYFYSPSI